MTTPACPGAPYLHIVRGTADIFHKVEVCDDFPVALVSEHTVIIVAKDTSVLWALLSTAGTNDNPVHEQRRELFELVEKLWQLLIPAWPPRMSTAADSNSSSNIALAEDSRHGVHMASCRHCTWPTQHGQLPGTSHIHGRIRSGVSRDMPTGVSTRGEDTRARCSWCGRSGRGS
jgi:hypothetical protein